MTAHEVIDERTGEVRQVERGAAVVTRGHSIARRELVGGLLQPVASPDEVLTAQEGVRAMVAKVLKKDRDFGVIEGTKRASLWKPGAERINAAYGLAAEHTVIDQEIDHDRPISYVKRTWEWGARRGEKIWSEEPGQSEGLYRYVVECRLIHRASGVMVGQGIGSCSTMESKYIDRPRDLENTVLKMASKRAYIAATLSTHGLSDQFEVDDEHEGAGGRETGPVMERTVPVGKHKGKTWASVLEEAPDYVQWAVSKMEKLSDGERAELRAALDAREEVARLAEAIRQMIEEIRALDPTRAEAAGQLADELLGKAGVTVEEMKRFGQQTRAALRSLQSAAPADQATVGSDGGDA